MREMSTFSRAMSQRVWRASDLGLGGGRGAGQLFVERGDSLLVLDQRVDAGDGGLDAGLHHLFGELFFVEDHHFLYVADAALEVFAESDDLANDDGRAGDGLEHAHLAALDALGDFDFAFARKQRHGAHFAQVHAHGVVGFFQRAGVRSSSTSSPSSSSKSLSPPNLGPSSRSMPWVPMVVIRSSRSSAEPISSGSMSFTSP